MREEAGIHGTDCPPEVGHVLSAARGMPELGPRQLASWVTDNVWLHRFGVHRLAYPGQGGLVNFREMQLAEIKQGHSQSTVLDRMWAANASSRNSVGSGRRPDQPLTYPIAWHKFAPR